MAQPRSRTPDLDRGEVPLPKVVASVPRLPSPAAHSPRPTPPPERVPADLGTAVRANPAQVKMADRPPVRRPPPADPGPADLPPLARPVPDRASLDDPTAELSAARVVFTALPLPAITGWFVRFGIPDPFELAGHLRGKTGFNRELGTAPVTVPPPRP
jgi:hypothetical protein